MTLSESGSGAQELDPSLGSLLFQPVLMVQPAENRRRNDAESSGEHVSVAGGRNLGLGWFRNARP